jgi:uncharacterized protein (TIGR02391 family)
MARKPVEDRPANLSAVQMEEAIPKIERRIADLESFDVCSVTERSDPRIGALENKMDVLLTGIFPPGTVEYQRYRHQLTSIDTASYNMYGTPLHEVHEGLIQGVATARETLVSIIEGFKEELEDAGRGTGSKTLRAYEGLELHPAIARASSSLYKDGHYANAIEDAVKALNALVRLNSGVDDRDGTSLMEFVFNPSSPVLKFNTLSDQSDRDEQKGFMMMFSGAVAGLRNPRAHRLIQDDSESALEFIAFVSLLAKLADKSVRSE